MTPTYEDTLTGLTLHPAQDYARGRMFYGIRFHGIDSILTSEGELLPTWTAVNHGISLVPVDSMRSKMSTRAVDTILDSSAKVSGAELFARIKTHLEKFVYFKDNRNYTVITLWIIGTYLHRIFRYYPYIQINAEKGSGKSTLIEVLAPIAFNGESTIDTTGIALAEQTHNYCATVFLDEAEYFRRSRSNLLMRILKSGFLKSGEISRKGKRLGTFSPKLFAGIDDIDDVLADRMIPLRMVRALPGEALAHYHETNAIVEWQQATVDMLYTYGLLYGPDIAAMYDIIPDDLAASMKHLNNRHWDLWCPLFVIAYKIDPSIVPLLKTFSEEFVRDKKDADADENETAILLRVLVALVHDVRPTQSEGNVSYFLADETYSYFLAQNAITDKGTRTTLSRLLHRKLGIHSVVRKVYGVPMRTYAVSTSALEDLRHRYMPTITESI